MNGKPWTSDEDALLRQLYTDHRATERRHDPPPYYQMIPIAKWRTARVAHRCDRQLVGVRYG